MRKAPLYLVTEDAFHTSYLLNQWHDTVGNASGGIIIRADRPATLPNRIAFHAKHAGKTELAPGEWKELERIYGGLSQSERHMVAKYGIPTLPDKLFASTTHFVGDDLNAMKALGTLESLVEEGKPQFFVFLDQILKHNTWLDIANDGRIYNAHSAILPYAPGMHSIEQVAAQADPQSFIRAAGATVHLVNPAVDAGDIIQTRPLPKPFAFDSLWDLKAASYKAAFDLLTGLAQQMVQHPGSTPKGTAQDMQLRPPKPFRTKDFTPEVAARAEAAFQAMKAQALSLREARSIG